MDTVNEHVIEATAGIPATEVRDRIALAAGAALLAAGLILVMFVLPAEFAVDPLGTGARLGLLPLGVVGQQVETLNAAAAAGGAGQGAIIVPQDRAFQQETVTFKVAAHEGMEYKYRLDKGEALLYSWSATVPRLRAPCGAGRSAGWVRAKLREAVEYRPGVRHVDGSLSGHSRFGYWENTGDQITVTLKTAGFYNIAHEFRSGAPTKNKMFN